MTKYIASCSFGKDSCAAILVALQHGIKIDEAVYCRIMFDDNISAELPEHEEWIHNVAIPTLRDRYGIPTTIVQGEKTYCSKFYRQFTRGNHVGEIRGFPLLIANWCNSLLKVRPIEKWVKQQNDFIQVVGIAADETKRINKKCVSNKFMPLVEYGINEADTFEICRNGGLLSPAYKDGTTRLGCWFCHNQRISELKKLRKEYPALWQRLLELQKDSPIKKDGQQLLFKPNKSLFDLEQRFANEDLQITIDDLLK